MTQDGVETATAERYEAKTNTWRAIASLPAPACATACAAGDDCFVFAWGSSSPAGGFYRYDPITDAYENLGELPLKNWFGFAAVADARDDVLYAVGGAVGGRWTGARSPIRRRTRVGRNRHNVLRASSHRRRLRVRVMLYFTFVHSLATHFHS